MEAEVLFHVTVLGVVTPEQYHRLQDAAICSAIAEVFRDRLNARVVTIERVARTDQEPRA